MSGPRARTLLASAVLAALVAAGCSGAGTTSTGGSSTGEQGSGDATTAETSGGAPTTSTEPVLPPPPPPEVGGCRALTYTDISLYANDAATKTCASDHTAYTFAVGELPADVAFAGVDIQNDAVQSAAADACTSRFVGFIGGDTQSRTLSRLTVTYFLPDQAAFDRGADWVRCDVVALQSPNSLAPLPTDLEGYLDDDSALDDFGVCSRGKPGGADSLLVMCSQEHTFRALSALRLGSSDAPYPGEGAARAVGTERCKDLVAKLLGTSGGFTYSWTYPSPADWADGQRFGYCWNEAAK